VGYQAEGEQTSSTGSHSGQGIIEPITSCGTTFHGIFTSRSSISVPADSISCSFAILQTSQCRPFKLSTWAESYLAPIPYTPYTTSAFLPITSCIASIPSPTPAIDLRRTAYHSEVGMICSTASPESEGRETAGDEPKRIRWVPNVSIAGDTGVVRGAHETRRMDTVEIPFRTGIEVDKQIGTLTIHSKNSVELFLLGPPPCCRLALNLGNGRQGLEIDVGVQRNRGEASEMITVDLCVEQRRGRQGERRG
jgi:hypothetical protein